MGHNIALLTTSFLPIQGGVQYLLYWLLKEIDTNYESYRNEFGFNEFFLIVPEYEDSQFDKFTNIKVEYILQSNGKLNTFKNALLVKKIIRKNQISLIHAHHALTDGFLVFLATLLGQTKYIITSHGVDFAHNKIHNYGERLSWARGMVIRLVAIYAHRITTVSNDMVAFVNEVVSSSKIQKIENCYEDNPEVYSRDSIDFEKNRLVLTYNISPESVVCLTLSGARKIKGHEVMLLEFSEALKKCPNLILFIAADGQETQSLTKLMYKLQLENNVFFIGFITGLQKKAFFEISDIYMNTAYFEPFGLVYLEAIQNNMAVLGSIYGGAKDIFEHGYSAYLSDPYKKSSITHGLIFLADKNQRNNTIGNAKPLLSEYSVNKILKKYFKLYKESLR